MSVRGEVQPGRRRVYLCRPIPFLRLPNSCCRLFFAVNAKVKFLALVIIALSDVVGAVPKIRNVGESKRVPAVYLPR
jgi:hypothetical protein